MPTRKISLYLMTEKGFRVLTHIVQHLDTALIAQVVGARDRSLARDYYDEMEALCQQAGIAFFNRSVAPLVAVDFALAISWRWLINDLDGRLIVMHDSLLPRYRGFSPLVNCLINGEPEIGVTALFATAEFDRGAVLGQSRRAITYPITIAQAIEQASGCYIELTDLLWPGLLAGSLLGGKPQDEAVATYSLWRDDEDYRLDWSLDAARLRRTVDALGWPYKGAAVVVDGALLRVMSANELPDVVVENRTPGKLLFNNDSGPVIVCGSGLLQLNDVRTEDGNTALPLAKYRVRFT